MDKLAVARAMDKAPDKTDLAALVYEAECSEEEARSAKEARSAEEARRRWCPLAARGSVL